MDKLKKAFVVLLLAVVGVSGGYMAYDKLASSDLQLGSVNTPETLAGTSSLLCLLPASYVEADATSTDASADGCTIDQAVYTQGYDKIIVQAVMKGGTATSTFSIRQVGSQDNTNFFNPTTSTSQYGNVYLNNATTTILTGPKSIVFEPGTATTTVKFTLDTNGADYTRLMLMGENLSTDPNDGVRAWIQVLK